MPQEPSAGQSDTSPPATSVIQGDESPPTTRPPSNGQDNSNGVLALCAVGAVLISVIALYQTARFNHQSLELQAEMATQQSSANQTQSAQAERGIEYEALSAYAAQTSVARHDEESQLRATLSATESPTVTTAPPEHGTPTRQPVPDELTIFEAESLVYEYFQTINGAEYAEAWSLLTPQFQQVFSSGDFASYQGFWQTVDNVEVVEAVPQQVNADQTEVKLIVRLRFFQGGFDWDRTYEYTVERTSAIGPWKIADYVLLGG